jgi:predicted phosphoribosyltransferase
VLNDEAIASWRIPVEVIDAAARAEEAELARRERAFRGVRPPVRLAGRTVILLDDGLATGSTMRAAVLAVRKQVPEEIVVAVPVGAPDTSRARGEIADEVVCPLRPEPFTAVGLWYDNFEQTSDEEVLDLLSRRRQPVQPASPQSG